jgi:hypothetical protein
MAASYSCIYNGLIIELYVVTSQAPPALPAPGFVQLSPDNGGDKLPTFSIRQAFAMTSEQESKLAWMLALAADRTRPELPKPTPWSSACCAPDPDRTSANWQLTWPHCRSATGPRTDILRQLGPALTHSNPSWPPRDELSPAAAGRQTGR